MRAENQPIPEWAEREREADLNWIGKNAGIFWSAAQIAYDEIGRGAIVIDDTIKTGEEVPPFGYFSQEIIDADANEDAQRMVGAYDPKHEFVIMLLKTDNRSSSYRFKLLLPEN